MEQLFADLSKEKRAGLLKGAIKGEGARIRRVAITAMTQAVKHSRDWADLKKRVRKIDYKKKAVGFRITVGPDKKVKGRPKLMFLEGGTDPRYTKTKTRIFRRKKRGHYTGAITARNFMAAAEREVDNATGNIRNNILKGIARIAKKRGVKYTQ